LRAGYGSTGRLPLYGEPWLEKMADDIGYSYSQLWRVAYDGAPITRRMQRELDKLVKRRKARKSAS
jgi:hypothetical protein